MKKYINKLVDFYKDEEGASGIEYAVVAVMVAVVIIGLTPALRTALTGLFGQITTGLTTTSGGGS